MLMVVQFCITSVLHSWT